MMRTPPPVAQPQALPSAPLRMSPLRRLTYRWLSLPYISRRRIAQDMHLEAVGEADELPDTQHEGRVLRRAQERGQLAALWDVVEARHADRVPPPNPFAPVVAS